MPSTWIDSANSSRTSLKSSLKALVLACLIGLNYYIFNFRQLAPFRDFGMVDYASNWLSDPNYVQRVWLLSFNLWRDLGIPAHILTSTYFGLMFGVGIFLTWQFSYKIYVELAGFDIQPDNNTWVKFVLFCLSWVYTYNPFIFERFLMGQDKIVLAHFLIMPLTYYLLEVLKNIKFNEPLRVKLRFFFWFLLLSLINLHYTIIMMLMSMVLLALTYETKFLYFQKSLVFVIVMVGLLSVSYLANYGISGHSLSYYSEIVYNDPILRNSIIEAFSPRPSESNYNAFLKIITGSGSWMYNTFFELENIKKELSWLSLFSPYFNQITGIVILILFGGLLFFSVRTTLKADTANLKLPLKRFAIALPLLGLFAGFSSLGYSFTWSKQINQWLYQIPGSYIFRESQKFYLLSIISFTLLVLVGLSRVHKPVTPKIKFFSVIIGIPLCISFFLQFIPLNSSLNYLSTPQIYDSILGKCNKKKLLWLPNDNYSTPSYSKTFIPNPARDLDKTRCQIQAVNYVQLNPGNNTNLIVLDTDKQNKEINQKIDEILVQVPAIKNNIIIDVQRDQKLADEFVEYLKIKEIEWLVIDVSNYSAGARLNTVLGTRLTPVEQQGNIYFYRLKS